MAGQEFLGHHASQTALLREQIHLSGEKVPHKMLLAELDVFPGRTIFAIHLVDDFDGAAVAIEFWAGGPLYPVALIGNFLDSVRRSLREDSRPMPDVEQEQPARRKVVSGDLERRLQRLIGRLVAHDMKKRNDRVKGAAEVRRTDISHFATEGASSFGGRRATGDSREGNHLRAALDAVYIKAHCR